MKILDSGLRVKERSRETGLKIAEHRVWVRHLYSNLDVSDLGQMVQLLIMLLLMVLKLLRLVMLLRAGEQEPEVYSVVPELASWLYGLLWARICHPSTHFFLAHQQPPPPRVRH